MFILLIVLVALFIIFMISLLIWGPKLSGWMLGRNIKVVSKFFENDDK